MNKWKNKPTPVILEEGSTEELKRCILSSLTAIICGRCYQNAIVIDENTVKFQRALEYGLVICPLCTEIANRQMRRLAYSCNRIFANDHRKRQRR